MRSWTGWRPLVVALCLAMIVLPLSLEGLDYRSFGGYPAVGFAAALLVFLGRRWVGWSLLAETVVIGIALSRSYDVSLPVGVAASTSITLPGLVVWYAVTRRGRHEFEIGTQDGERLFIAATAVGALLCGVLAGAFSLIQVDPSDALLTAVMSFLGSLAALLAVLPVLDRGSAAANGTAPERAIQWVILLAVAGAVFWPRTTLPLVFLLPAVLSWGANRGSPRSSHLQLLVTSLIAYLLTFAGHGPLAEVPDTLPAIYGPIVLYLFLVACAYVAIPISGSVSRMQQVTLAATRSATTMERLFESARRTLIMTTDAEGVISRVNRGAEIMTGYPAEELIGRTPAVFLPREEMARQATALGVDPHDHRGMVAAIAAAGERSDWRVLTKDGRLVIVSVSVTRIDDDGDGGATGYVAVGDDSTARHAAHEALSTALEREHASVARLREVDRVKQELVSNVSHELRTPITSISGYAELLADGAMGGLTTSQRQVVDRIDRNSRRLIRLVEDLLILSRHESGALVLHRAPADLGGLLREVVLLLEEQLRQRSLTLDVDVPDRPVVVSVDVHELERVLVNLVGNAIKFTPDGGRVDVGLTADDERATFTVSDTGVGIAEDEQDQLFGRFFRASSAVDNAIQGTGLGLSIAHSIVTAHGGTIGVASSPGKGTTMTVCLPRAHGEVADEPLFAP